MGDTLLEIRDLVTEFRTEHGVIRAVDKVSFEIPKGKTWGWSVNLVAASRSPRSV